jgi:hypothetical protein
VWANGRVGEMAMGRLGVAETQNGRAKNSARRWRYCVLALFRAGFEPLWWCCEYHPIPMPKADTPTGSSVPYMGQIGDFASGKTCQPPAKEVYETFP